MNDKHPMQPILLVDGIARFKQNAIVRFLLDTYPDVDMNRLACIGFSEEDRSQFAQLIGYSVSGYGDLSYAIDVEKADEIVRGLVQEKSTETSL